MNSRKIVAIITILIIILNIIIPNVTLAVDVVEDSNISSEKANGEVIEERNEEDSKVESVNEQENTDDLGKEETINNAKDSVENKEENSDEEIDIEENKEATEKKKNTEKDDNTNINQQLLNTENTILEPSALISYKTHVEKYGWQDSVEDGEMTGTTGQELRLEAIQIKLGNSKEIPEGASIEYQVHAQDYGWMSWKKDGETSGTTGESKRVEAIRIELKGMEGYSVVYRTHVQDIGWTDWVNNGEISGTTGQSKRVEAIEIKIVKNPKIEVKYKYNESENTVTATITSDKQLSSINDSSWILSEDKLSYTKEYNENDTYQVIVENADGVKTEIEVKITQIVEPISMVKYSSHIQMNGWEKSFSKRDGEISGTTGEDKRLEAIKITLGNSDEIPKEASIEYQVHVQDYGWMDWKKDGEIAGTTGEEKRIEAIKIKLEGMAGYSVVYRTHVQDIGWTDWVKNEEISGTVGESKRVEAIEIRIVKNPEIKVNYTYNQNNNTVTAMITSDKQLSSINDSSWTLSEDKLLYTKEYDVNDNYNVLVTDIDGIEIGVQVNITQVVEPISMVKYSSHIQEDGWEKKYSKIDGETSGTTGERKRLEAIQISLGNSKEVPEGASIKYQVHVQDYGWMDWKQDGEIAGTTGEEKRIEAIQIKLEGMEGYSIEYRVHIEGSGWQKWKSDGEIAGTVGEDKRVEAIQIKVAKIEDKIIEPSVEYQVYVRNDGWQEKVLENTIAGTTGQSKGIQSLKIDLKGASGDSLIKYRTYAQNRWQDWVNSDELTGKAGQTNIQAIQIELGNINGYSIEYRVHVSGYGWQKWRKDGETAGITGNNIEAIQIRIVYNNSVTLEPEVSYQAYVQQDGWNKEKAEGLIAGTQGESKRIEAIKINLFDVTASQKIKYRVHVQDIGWQPWVENGAMAGTTGQNKRIEAIQIKLEGMDDYTVEYQVHIQDHGWTDWMIDGETAGTTGESKRIEAIRIRIVPKYYRMYNGIDVSEHNGLIDWQSVKNSGVQFAMIRCAYRGYRNPVIVKDKYFDYNVRNATAVGIKVGIYFFSQATSITEAVEEANYAINLAKQYGNCIKYPIAIDTESSGAENNDGRADGLGVALRTTVVAAFCNQVNNCGYTPMVYASRNWLYNNLEVTRLSTYETWLAHYTNDSSVSSDYKYDYTMWQYTSSGSVPGISGRTDLNIGYKTY